MFDIGLSLPVIVVLFLCTLLAVNRLLLRPLQAVIDERERRTVGTLRESEKSLEHYQTLFERYKQSIKKAQLEGYKLQDDMRAEVAQVRSKHVAEARSTAETTIARMKEDLARQVAESKEQLRKDAEEISGKIAALILQKSA